MIERLGPMGRFKQAEVDDLLVACHRRCCICHRFCGVKIEMDHMLPQAEGGDDNISNAIAVCFECHAEIHSYNDSHPRGRKFRPEELHKHKDQWLAICRERPSELLAASRNADVGPLQALVDELTFNHQVANDTLNICPFMMDQLKRAITEGILSMLSEQVRRSLIAAYHKMSVANQAIQKAASAPAGAWLEQENSAKHNVQSSAASIQAALQQLVRLLGSESADQRANS